MESSSVSSSTTTNRIPTPLIFDAKALTSADVVPPLPQLEHHHHHQPHSPSSTPSPTTGSPTSLLFPDFVEDDAIVVDAGADGDDEHHHPSPDDDPRSPLSASAFPTSPSLGGDVVAPASPVKPSPSPLQRSLSQLSSLSLSTRSLGQSQHQQQQGLLSPSLHAFLSASSRKSSIVDGSEVPTPTQPTTPTPEVVSTLPPDGLVSAPPTPASPADDSENEVEAVLNTTTLTITPSEKSPAPTKSEEEPSIVAVPQDIGTPTPKTAKGKEKATTAPDSEGKPLKFNGSRFAKKSGNQYARQSYASPDPFYNPNATTNVYINGLPPFFTHEQLSRLASEFGKVLSSRVFHRFSQIKPNGSGQQQGSTYAFVLYETVEDASRCITSLRKYSDLHPSFARTQRLPTSRPQQPTTAEGLLDKNRPEYRGSPEVPDRDAAPPPPPQAAAGAGEHGGKDDEEVDVLIQGLPINTTHESVQALIGDRIIALSITLLPIGTEQKRDGRQIAYVRLGSRKDANDVISKLHMTRVLGFGGNNDRSTVPPTLQVVEINPTTPHDSVLDVNMQGSDLPYGSPSPPRHPVPGRGPSHQPSASLDHWTNSFQSSAAAAQPLPGLRTRSTSNGTTFPQPHQHQLFDGHPLLVSQLFPQLPASASMPQPFIPRTQPGFRNLGLGLPGQRGMPFNNNMPQERARALLPVDAEGGRRAVSMPFPHVLGGGAGPAVPLWPPLSASVSAPSQLRAAGPVPPSPPHQTTAGPGPVRPFMPNLAPPPPARRHLQVGPNAIPLTVNQQAAQAYSARFRQRVGQPQPQAQEGSIWEMARPDGEVFTDDLAPPPQAQQHQAPAAAPVAQTQTPAPSRRRAYRRNAGAGAPAAN